MSDRLPDFKEDAPVNEGRQPDQAELYRLLAESSTDVILRTTPDGVCTYASPASLRILGYRPEEMIGFPLFQAFHPEDIPPLMKVRESIRCGELETFLLDVRFLHKDQSYVWTETSGRVFFDAAGRPVEVQVSARDVTKLRTAEMALRRSEQQYRLLAENSTDIIIRCDYEGTLTYVSPACIRMTGYKPSELLGRTVDFLVHPDDMPHIRGINSRIAASKTPLTFSCRYLKKDGSHAWLETVARPVFDEEGRFLEFQASVRDVTDRHRMEQDLQAYQERLDAVVKNMDAILCQVDSAGVITLAEGRSLSVVERWMPDLLGRSLFDVVGRSPTLLISVRQAMEGHRSSAEFTVGDSTLEAIFTPSRSPDGGQDGIIALAVDVTDRKRTEQRLSEEKERLRVTLQSIGEGVIATDGDGRVVLINGVAEELTGWRFDMAVGRPFAEVFQVFDEETGEPCASPVASALSTGSASGQTGTMTLRSAGGAQRHIAVNAAPILDTARRVLGAILVFRDVTDARKKESEITYLSYHDMLTGLYNRTFFEEECKRLDTERQLPISIIMGDVNGLKLTNDVFGHAEGDNLLVRITTILRESCRDEDIVARVGGDEFCILLPMTGYASASEICRRIYAHCEKAEYGLPSGSAKLSISLGFATKTTRQETMAGIMKAAEDMMYRRKLLESRSQHSALISSIRTTLFEKSFETEHHARRLIANCKAIASALDLPDDQINDVELFALLHDIGKIAIDSRILTKEGELNDAEWTEMRRHPEIGFRIAQASPDLAHIAEYILCHHERWDGTGYPQGLKGTAIPLLARIMLVVDSFDAMTQDRVYRKAMTREEACTELMMNAGTQFDPNIVWVFMELLEKDSYPA